MIDCERHVVAPTLDALFPYMEEAWVHRLEMSEFRLPPGSPHPGLALQQEPPESSGDPKSAAAALPDSIELALLVPTQGLPSPGWLDHMSAAVFVGALNDYVAEAWVPAEPRFRQAIALAPNDADLAAAEVRRKSSDTKVAAAVMSVGGVNLGHVRNRPLLEALAAAELPLIVHPSGVEGTVQGGPTLAAGGPYTAEETLALLPQVAVANIASLVFEGVFEQLPGLRVVFAGFGFDWAPPVLWRMDAEWRGLRVEVPWVTRPPSAYVGEQVRFVADAGSGLFEHAELWETAEMLSLSTLVYGSDAPFASDQAERALLSSAPDGLRQRVADENARATFPRLRHAEVQL